MSIRAANTNNYIACLEGVRVTYDAYLGFALIDANLEVRRGEILGLIGPKGSGKSTTLKLLAGRLRPHHGKVKVFGRSPRRSTTRKGLGFLAEANSQSKSVGLRGFLQRWTGFGVQSAVNLPNHVRVAHLLVKRPEFLLLDEPFANLDAEARSEMMNIICKFAGEGKTVVLAQETLAGVMDVCHRLAIYFRGQILAVGTLQELLALPDAIRILGPVLPTEIGERVLQSIRAELPEGSPVNKSLALRFDNESKSVDAVQRSRDGPKDTVDHERLRRLTKPAG